MAVPIQNTARHLPSAAFGSTTYAQAYDSRRSMPDLHSEITQSGDWGRRATAWEHAFYWLSFFYGLRLLFQGVRTPRPPQTHWQSHDEKTAGRDCGSRGVHPASVGAGRATVF